MFALTAFALGTVPSLPKHGKNHQLIISIDYRESIENIDFPNMDIMLPCLMDFKSIFAELKALTMAERRLLAKRAKVGYTTINNIVYKRTVSPGVKTLARIEKALK